MRMLARLMRWRKAGMKGRGEEGEREEEMSEEEKDCKQVRVGRRRQQATAAAAAQTHCGALR